MAEHKSDVASSPRREILLTLYPEVTDDGKVDTLQFLEASRSVIRIYDTLGTALIVAKKDMLGNVENLTEIYRKSPGKYQYLNDMIFLEKDDPSSNAIIYMLWLKRALEFTAFFVKRLIVEFKEKISYEGIGHIAEEGYNKILKPHHNYLMQNLFKVLFKAFPNRSKILNAVKTSFIGTEYSMEECLSITSENFSQLEANLLSIIRTYRKNGIEIEDLQL